MYTFDDVNKFPRVTNERVKTVQLPVKNKRKFISAICVGTIYCDVL